MAKTTSQIIAENKIKRAEAAAIAASRDKIHQQQMAGVAEESAAKTFAVLNKAISGTTDSTKKSELSRAAQMVKEEYTKYSSQQKSGAKTATDMQKKKENRIEEKHQADSLRIKKDRAEKQLDEHVNSDSHKKAIDDDHEKKLNAITQRMLTGGMDTYTPEVLQDETEQRILAEIRKAETEHDAFVAQKDREYIEELTAEEQDILEQYAVNQIRDQNLPVEMVGVMPTARQEAAGLIGKNGQKRMDELAESYMRQKNAELAQQVERQSREFADKHGIIGSALTVPVAALNGVVGTVGQLQGWARNTGRYSTLDPNATGTIGDVFTGAVRDQVAQNIEGENPTLLNKGLSVGYQGLMSAADSIARAYLGGGAFGGATLAATSSFSQTMADAARQGATPAQAALLATATSGIEALTEAMPLDDLIRTAKGGNPAGFIANVFRQMGIEAVTEEVSLLGSIIAEASIMQEKSSYNQTVNSLILLGKTEVEARQIAAEEIFNEALNTALVSAVAGIGSGVSAAAANEMNLFAETGNNTAADNPQKNDVVKSKAELFKKYGRDPLTGEKMAQETVDGFATDMNENAPLAPVTAPLTEEQQYVENASAAINGMEPEQMQKTAVPEETAENIALETVGLLDAIGQQVQNSETGATNRMAEAVMNDPAAMDQLMQQTMAEIAGTKAEQRRAVKEALNRMFNSLTEETVDSGAVQRYNNTRSEQVQGAIDRLNSGGDTPPTIEEIMSIPEIAEAERANDGLETINLPNREQIREDGYQQAMQKGSWNGKDYSGEVRRNRRMDIVIGLPGSGKSSVYTERLSQEHKSRVIDTDDFREYIPEYNGSNASVVHEEASNIRNRVLLEALDNGDNLLLSTIGANGEKLAKQIAQFKEDGYQVYLHLNELPNNKSLARAIGRYISEDGKIGRYVSPQLIAAYGDKPTETYLYLTGQGGNKNGGLGSDLRTVGGQSSENAGGTSTAPENTAVPADLLTGYDWYNNDVARGEAPRLIQTSEQQKPQVQNASAEVQNGMPTTDTQTVAYARVTDVQNQSADGGQQPEPDTEQPKLQRERINSVRDQAIPVTDPYGKVVSEAAGNIYTSSRTPDSFAENIRRLVNEGRVSHDVQTNEESLNKAAASIAEDGNIQNALNSIKEVAASGRTGAIDVAKGVLIYDELVNSSDSTHQALAEECFVALSQLATNTGRPMQLYSLFRKMSPESQVRTLEREVHRNVERLQKAGTIKKGYKADIDPKLMDLYRESAEEMQKAQGDKAKRETEVKMQEIQNVIYAEVAAKMPTTFKAKWDAWRYMAMLGNVKTQVRNLAGNTLMLPYTDAKRAVGAILEKGISKDKRTKAVFVDSQLLKWAKQDRVNVKSVLDGSAKLGDNTATNPLADNIKTFGDKWIGERFNDMQGIINKAVSGGDMLFKNGEYARSLAGFLKARGYTVKDVQTDGGVPVDVLNEARNYAINEALKATFNDTNMLSDALANGLRYKGDNPIMKAINTLGEGLMPFRKTPANVVMRFKDYSPAGLVQGVWNLAANVRNGKVTAATAIDQIAAGLTGTALMQLGYVLAGGIAGVKLTGSGADEDEKRQGHQNYAVEFSVDGQEYSYTIDWAVPANLPLFLGANIRAMQEAPDTASFLTATANAAMGAIEPLLELSCMSSMNDFFEGIRYAGEGEALYSAIANLATNYFTQGIPALARQTTQAANEYKQTSFVTSDDPLIQKGQKGIAGLGVGNVYKTDKRNAWGEKEEQGDWMTRAFNSFVNPGTLKKIDNSAAELEISRLNKAGYNVTPNTAARTVSYIDKDGTGHDDVRLTEEQFQKLAETQGQTARKLLDDMISSASYAALSDEQKADAIDTAYLYARKTGEIAAIEDHTGYDQSWFYDVEKGGAEEIVRRVLNSGLNTSMSDLDTAWDRGYNEETFNRELQTAYESYHNAPADMRKQVFAEAEGTAKKYIEARDKGVSHEDFVAAAENIAKVKGTGSINKDTGKATVRDIDRRQAIANTAGMTEKEVDIVMKAYMADYDPSDESPETTEMKYDYIRQELDLSAKEYTATYRAYLDNSKKAQRIAAIRALGYDYGTALKLYKVYSGSMKKKLIDMYG